MESAYNPHQERALAVILDPENYYGTYLDQYIEADRLRNTVENEVFEFCQAHYNSQKLFYASQLTDLIVSKYQEKAQPSDQLALAVDYLLLYLSADGTIDYAAEQYPEGITALQGNEWVYFTNRQIAEMFSTQQPYFRLKGSLGRVLDSYFRGKVVLRPQDMVPLAVKDACVVLYSVSPSHPLYRLYGPTNPLMLEVNYATERYDVLRYEVIDGSFDPIEDPIQEAYYNHLLKEEVVCFSKDDQYADPDQCHYLPLFIYTWKLLMSECPF